LGGEKTCIPVANAIGIADKREMVHIVLQRKPCLSERLIGQLRDLSELALGPVVYHEDVEIVPGGDNGICF
jgi:hypothetical protein